MGNKNKIISVQLWWCGRTLPATVHCQFCQIKMI